MKQASGKKSFSGFKTTFSVHALIPFVTIGRKIFRHVPVAADDDDDDDDGDGDDDDDADDADFFN